jgi:hypothetical protein
MRFAQSDTAKENHIAFFIDEPESEQVFYLELVDFFGPGPLELLKCFDLGKARGADAAISCAVQLSNSHVSIVFVLPALPVIHNFRAYREA